MIQDKEWPAHPPLPTFAQIEPVGACNLRCPMCFLSLRKTNGAGPAFLPFDDYRKILDELPQLSELHLQGLGEPLLHPEFCEMAEEAASRGIHVSTNTNLSLLQPASAQRLLRSLETLFVSVDAGEKTAYEAIRLGTSFETLESNLAVLAGHTGPRRARLVFVAVLMRSTLGELEDLVKFSHRWSAKALHVQHLCRLPDRQGSPAVFQPLHSFTGRESLARENPLLLTQVFSRARDLAEELGVELRLPPLGVSMPADTPKPETKPATEGPPCDWPWRGVYVTYRGELLPCCMAALPEAACLGELSRQTLPSAWRGDAYVSFRRQLASTDPPSVCHGCAIYDHLF